MHHAPTRLIVLPSIKLRRFDRGRLLGALGLDHRRVRRHGHFGGYGADLQFGLQHDGVAHAQAAEEQGRRELVAVEAGLEVLLGREAFGFQAFAIALDRHGVAGGSSVAQLELRQQRARGFVGGTGLALAAVFLPGILLQTAALPFWNLFRGQRLAQAAMRGVNAAELAYIRSDPEEAQQARIGWVEAMSHKQAWAFGLAKFFTDPDEAMKWLEIAYERRDTMLPHMRVTRELVVNRLALPDALAERTYAVWPDLEALMREHGVPQFTVDSHRPVGSDGSEWA